MALSHRENVGCLREDRFGNLSASEVVKGCLAVSQEGRGLGVAWGPFGGGNAGRTHLIISPFGESLAEESFRHRAATGVSSANEQDIFEVGHRD